MSLRSLAALVARVAGPVGRAVFGHIRDPVFVVRVARFVTITISLHPHSLPARQPPADN